ncbi:MAG TPA: hypothetical protein VLG11_03950 [Candidatus Saccharimonadales bacterium]|nr:hypothetical protein [Candidatus Saccharimonadales bacterium]
MTGEGEPEMSAAEHAELARKNAALAAEATAVAIGLAALAGTTKNSEAAGGAVGSALLAAKAASEAAKHGKAAKNGE